jgi:glucosamine-6-phosphate deaminase
VVTLFDQTRRDNARFFKDLDSVPYFAVTMGVGTIMEARKILLLANGKNKARVVADFIEGPVTSMISASILQNHQKCIVVVDEEAATELKYSKEYRWIQHNKHRIRDFIEKK